MSESDEEFVRRHWERAESCPRGYSDQDPTWCISLGGRLFTRANVPDPNASTEGAAWTATRAFTEECLEQIRQVEEEIAAVRDILDDYDATVHTDWSRCFQRILARETKVLEGLRRGMKAQ